MSWNFNIELNELASQATIQQPTNQPIGQASKQPSKQGTKQPTSQLSYSAAFGKSIVIAVANRIFLPKTIA